MEKSVSQNEQALQHIESLIALLEPNEQAMTYALKIRERLRVPISEVLDKLWPELGPVEKARKLGVARQTYYGWEQGWFRPIGKFAKKISAATGYSVNEISGRLPPRR